MGPGCSKVLSITLFVQSVWDYSPRNPSGPGKQCHGLQLIAQLHSLPTLSKINSHHASNFFPLSPLRQQLPDEPPVGERRLHCPESGRSHLPLGRASRGLPGPRCRGFRFIPHTKMLGVILKPNTDGFLHTRFLLCAFRAWKDFFFFSPLHSLLVLIHRGGGGGTHATP